MFIEHTAHQQDVLFGIGYAAAPNKERDVMQDVQKA